MGKYRYETHMHTSPVSRCAKASVRDNLEFYKNAGYDGVFITNHFLDGNIGISSDAPYEEKISYYFSDYEEAVRLSGKAGIKVFCGVEISNRGTDFLIYGLGKDWYLAHPEIADMEKSDELALMMDSGALIIQAHPFREAGYIDHIRLYPRHVHGAEVINACRTDFENRMAKLYAQSYGLLEFAGTDNHVAGARPFLAGMCCDTPIKDERDFAERVKHGEMSIFTWTNDQAAAAADNNTKGSRP